MPIIRLKSHRDLYSQVFALQTSVHALSGRYDPAETRFVAERIVEQLDLQPDDAVLDIGCGDGSLLRLVAGRVGSGLGLLPSAEELRRLEDCGNVRFEMGFAQRLPVPDGWASKVVCNAVLILLPPAEVELALREMQRVARAGALVFVGEVPERAEVPTYDHSSLRALLRSSTRRHGIKGLAAVLRDLVLNRPIVLHPYDLFCSPPHEFLRLAQECGFEVVRQARHATPSGESLTRWDYLLRRQK